MRTTLLALLGILLISYPVFLAPSTQAKPEQAHSADSFIDSIGVAVHLGSQNTAYKHYEKIIKPRLQELGIHHIRDGLAFGDRENQKKFHDLAKVGIKLTFVRDPRDVSQPGDVLTPEKAVKQATSMVESLVAIEGPNEWDIQSHLQYQGQNFPEGVRRFQAELYRKIKANKSTDHLPILSPSMANPDHVTLLGKVACDINNMHIYPGSQIPKEFNTRFIQNTKKLCGNKPIIITETGYHNAIHEPRNHKGISEQVAAKLIPRLFLEFFNRGIQRTFVYELIDEHPNPKLDDKEKHFGLLRYDGSRKPAFIALRNLITLLKDSKTKSSKAFTPQHLDYQLSGSTFNVHHTLLQKRNGIFYLVLWQDFPGFNVQNKKEIIVVKKQVFLTLNEPVSHATTYQPNDSIYPLMHYENEKKISLGILDYPLVVELVPGKNE
ncbi:MAG: hypothetical protein HC768_01010 [Acaryochloris sp. CRU_2_0]|nr:hypothetical protein [Acaryochloris sp. CRU_2_0]